MLVKLLAALEAEGVTAWERQRFFVIVVVGFEANSTLEYIIHF
jgi:hypothetical protein